jgi:uncharacterized protein (TIGR02246 family)
MLAVSNEEVAPMRSLNVIVVCMVAAFGCARQQVDLESVRAAVRAADQNWLKATASNDMNAFLSYISTSGSMLPPGRPAVNGPDAIREWASAMFSAPGFSITWKPATVDVAASADLGYTRGAYELHMPGPNGMPMRDRGKYVTVWRKESDGKWRVVVDMFNSDAPPSATPAMTDTTAAPDDTTAAPDDTTAAPADTTGDAGE